ncbi:MAG TPA: serine/threonine protein kinase, partial [Xanthomonadales bacterium]|nr:serine/threonine protein kinase [Xanthomonadales bacterium]
EARALRALDGLVGVPRLLRDERGVVARSYIAGRPMQEARPADPAYFRAARRLVTAMHARGVAHNDLAKEPNWLVTDAGAPAVIDFQLAWFGSRRSRFFRLLALQDLRHLLKHKRTYCPQSLTPVERRVLARRSWLARTWKATFKRFYFVLTRKVLRYQDNEGKGLGPRA